MNLTPTSGMDSKTAAARRAAHRFEDLLPNSDDPAKARLRNMLVHLLNSEGDILPSSDKPLGKLWRLVNNPNSSIDDCQEIIQLDPSLTSKIFRVSNSAAFNARATDIAEALRFIGFKVVREMVFNSGVLESFSGLKVPPEWEIFWLRNIFTARLSDRIAGSFFSTDGSEYLAGLIHDVGWLFLATHFPEEFAKIVASEKPTSEAEREVLPFSHANIAAAIGARASMPLKAVDAVAYHHKQALTTTSTLVQPSQNPLFLAIILNVCDKIADGCQLDLFGKTPVTLEDVRECPEFIWLKNYGKKIDLEAMASEELVKSQEIYTVFFTE